MQWKLCKGIIYANCQGLLPRNDLSCGFMKECGVRNRSQFGKKYNDCYIMWLPWDLHKLFSKEVFCILP